MYIYVHTCVYRVFPLLSASSEAKAEESERGGEEGSGGKSSPPEEGESKGADTEGKEPSR